MSLITMTAESAPNALANCVLKIYRISMCCCVQVMNEDELKMGNGMVWNEGMRSMWHCDTSTNCINEWR